MAYKLGDRVVETTNVTGTGSASLLGAQTNYQAFSAVLTAGDKTYYTIVDSTNNAWEVGIGTYSVGSLSRDTVLESSNSNLKVYFGSGTKDIWIDLPSEGVVQGPASAANGNLVVFDGTTGKILKDAGYAVGAANGVASLDSGGKVPTSQLPAMGDLNYQGAWNASTNTPTLASGVGTKGYYYVVSVAGSTNLDGITDWVAGDWAVFNGTVWQKVDNTQAYPGAGIANSTGTSWGTSYSTTGSGTVVALQTAASLSNPTISNYVDFGNGSATTLAAGRMWYDSTTGSWNLGMGGGNITQQVGEEQFIYGKASAAITEGQLVCKTGANGASGVITFAPSPANLTDNDGIIGVATENIALNGFGRITTFGVVHGINTTGASVGETWADGDTLWYNPAGSGTLTNVKPTAPNIKFAVATVTHAGPGGSGSIQVDMTPGSVLGGTDANVQMSTPSNGQILTYDGSATYWKNTSLTAGTAISVSASSGGVLTITNTAPDQTVTLTGAGTTTVTGTYPNFTITSNDQYTGTVTSVTGTSPISVATGTTTPVVSMTQANTSTNGWLSSTDWNTFNNKSTLPSQSGHTGEFLKTDGSTTSWSTLPTALPVLNRSGSTVSVSVGNGLLPVLTHAGSTVNVAVN